MDKDVSVEDLKSWVKRFCDERGWDDPHTAKDLAIGAVTEASELLEIFRFVPKEKEGEVLLKSREHIADELADSLYFLLRFAQMYDFDLATALQRKLEKNVARYPKCSSI